MIEDQLLLSEPSLGFKKAARVAVLEAAGWNWDYTTTALSWNQRSKLRKAHPLFCSLLQLIAVGMGQGDFYNDFHRVFQDKFRRGDVLLEALAYGDLNKGSRTVEKRPHVDTTWGTRDCLGITRAGAGKGLSYTMSKTRSKIVARFDLGTCSMHRAADRVRSLPAQDSERLQLLYHLAVSARDCLTLVVTYPKGGSFTTEENVVLITEVYDPAIRRLAGYINGTYVPYEVMRTLDVR